MTEEAIAAGRAQICLSASQGLTRVEARIRGQVQAICDFFDVAPVERIWSRQLVSIRCAAAEYGANVDEILRWTASLTHLAAFEHADGVSPISLMRDIDEMHEALQQSGLEQQHKRRWNREQDQQEKSRRKRTSVGSEYAKKVRLVLCRDRLETGEHVENMLTSINIAYHWLDAAQLVHRLRDEFPSVYDLWLERFDGNEQEFRSGISGDLDEWSMDELFEVLVNKAPAPEGDG